MRAWLDAAVAALSNCTECSSRVNVFGAMRLTQLALPHMRAQRSGTVVNISARRPKTRCAVGFGAKPGLAARRVLPDRIFDNVIARASGVPR